jgi:superfamily II DNA/RNA helicase
MCLEETEGKAIIWANYQRDITNIIESIVKEYGPGSVVDYYGLTPQEERQENIKRFQNNDECRFIVGTPHKQVVMVLHLHRLILLFTILMDMT